MDVFSLLFHDEWQDNKIQGLANSQTRSTRQSTELVKRLREENDELRIRVGALIRLLIEQDVFSAEDYAATVKDLKAQISSRS